MNNKPEVKYLKDYKVPNFLINKVELVFELDAINTVVEAKLYFKRNAKSEDKNSDLVLDGQHIELISIHLDAVKLDAQNYTVDPSNLRLRNLPDEGVLTIKNSFSPAQNSRLSGLYCSGDTLVTQNEAEGFRNITYFLDRPDVMSEYKITLIADRKLYPILLSNGNLVEEKLLSDNKHMVVWHDPHLKPCYLFALVAGEFDLLEDHYVTKSGRKVTLRIYSDVGNSYRCHWAMESLKNSFKWDEERFNLEYDLDLFNIVATRRFNHGAMENKSLNIFNSSCVYSERNTAIDNDFALVESIIAHEYFHNWTGNRVTCRDWFQLSLKEGLTVFRDQLFSEDMRSAVVERIKNVEGLRRKQFVEDISGMAHSIRPEEYITIDNFYTNTVYQKGSEVIRMLHTLLGEEGFQKGMKLYFERHDGQAVTCEDFLSAMQDANDRDLDNFKLWYRQAGTPEVKVNWHYNSSEREFTLNFRQKTPDTRGQSNKKAVFIPMKMGLIAKNGQEVVLNLKDSPQKSTKELVLLFKDTEQSFIFTNVDEGVVPSLNRGFSAPVNLDVPYTYNDLKLIIKHDSDLFNRNEALRSLLFKLIKSIIDEDKLSSNFEYESNLYSEVFGDILKNIDNLEASFVALLLKFPSVNEVLLANKKISVAKIVEIIESFKLKIATDHKDVLFKLYHEFKVEGEYKSTEKQQGYRELSGSILDVLGTLKDKDIEKLAYERYRNSNNLTDKIIALKVLLSTRNETADKLLVDFYQSYKDVDTVLDKWFLLQSSSKGYGSPKDIKALTKHADFDWLIPDRVRSVLSGFIANSSYFYTEEGFELIKSAIIKLDQSNADIASRVAGAFNIWNLLDNDLSAIAKGILNEILLSENVSDNVYEIVKNYLESASS